MSAVRIFNKKILYNRLSCQILSKALAISKKMTAEYLLLFQLLHISSKSLTSWRVVECSGLNTNCSFLIFPATDFGFPSG